MPVKEHFVVVLDLVLVEAGDLPKFDSKNFKFLVKKRNSQKLTEIDSGLPQDSLGLAAP